MPYMPRGADLTGGYRVSLPKTLTLTVQSLLPHPCENPCPRALVLIYKILGRWRWGLSAWYHGPTVFTCPLNPGKNNVFHGSWVVVYFSVMALSKLFPVVAFWVDCVPSVSPPSRCWAVRWQLLISCNWAIRECKRMLWNMVNTEYSENQISVYLPCGKHTHTDRCLSHAVTCPLKWFGPFLL